VPQSGHAVKLTCATSELGHSLLPCTRGYVRIGQQRTLKVRKSSGANDRRGLTSSRRIVINALLPERPSSRPAAQKGARSRFST
jgi:hypothetical protein